MPNTIDLYTPRYMSAVVRNAPPVSTFFRDTFFTQRETFPTERIDFDLVKGDRKMAAFVHPRAGAVELRGAGYETKSYAAPLISNYDITTADQLMSRMPGEDLYSGITPAERAAQKLVDDYARISDAINRREEWMCSKALLEGRIPIVGKGINDVIDFQFTQKKTLSGSKCWDKADARILDDLGDWQDEVLTNGFANVNACIMGKKAYRAFRDNQAIRDILDNRRIFMGEVAPRTLPGGVKYIGHLSDPDLDLYTYSDVFLDDWTDPESPELCQIMPDNQLILIDQNASFKLSYGAITYLEESGNWQTTMTNRLALSYIMHNPDRRVMEVSARPLPIPQKVDSWLVATVIEE